jgi:hypothetical protein
VGSPQFIHAAILKLHSTDASESSLMAVMSASSAILPSTPASPVSPTSNAPTDTPASQANLKTSVNSSTHAGSIAGGVLGGALVLALITLAAIYLMRRRRKMRVPPSAEFMPVVVPVAGNMVSQDGLPPPFSPGMWSGSVLEKVHTTSTEREFTPGSLSMAHTWDHDSERV